MVSRETGEAASLCPPPGRVKMHPSLASDAAPGRNWGGRRAPFARAGGHRGAQTRRIHHRSQRRDRPRAHRAAAREGERPILTLDLKPLEPEHASQVQRQFTGSILDDNLLERILSEYEVDLVFHLAALLSTRGEFTPITAHQVNVEGMLRMLEFAQKEGESHGRPVVFLYPCSIAAYGMPGLETKARAGKVNEDDLNDPTTMYGCNKLYCEHLGRYYARHYKQLAAEPLSGKVDFRCVRFPGLISAVTVPRAGPRTTRRR